MIQYHLIESWERSSRTLSGVRGALRQYLAEPPTRLPAGVFVHRVIVSVVNIELPCHSLLCLSGCLSVYFYFFEALGNLLKQFLSALVKQALLQFLVCGMACANCKCACF